MFPVLLQEEDTVSTAVVDPTSFHVDVQVQVDDNDVVSFVPVNAFNFTIEEETITLKGSGGSPREFEITFTLITSGYLFMNPALKFFQGGSTNAGFRVSPDAAATSAQVVLFNTLGEGDQPVQDTFSVLVRHISGKTIIHDPTIVWDPPNG
jgi:hypothetical protein